MATQRRARGVRVGWMGVALALLAACSGTDSVTRVDDGKDSKDNSEGTEASNPSAPTAVEPVESEPTSFPTLLGAFNIHYDSKLKTVTWTPKRDTGGLTTKAFGPEESTTDDPTSV